ncbi:MAG: hypothetical protein BWZ10_03058 [candidate division BRC1 bacterium ADurb.BinA364]|nr:MAG: hypothetical protein BWZ10_03058 [candidate division BRC1 bacterium ADurb.BinA364]
MQIDGLHLGHLRDAGAAECLDHFQVMAMKALVPDRRVPQLEPTLHVAHVDQRKIVFLDQPIRRARLHSSLAVESFGLGHRAVNADQVGVEAVGQPAQRFLDRFEIVFAFLGLDLAPTHVPLEHFFSGKEAMLVGAAKQIGVGIRPHTGRQRPIPAANNIVGGSPGRRLDKRGFACRQSGEGWRRQGEAEEQNAHIHARGRNHGGHPFAPGIRMGRERRR